MEGEANSYVDPQTPPPPGSSRTGSVESWSEELLYPRTNIPSVELERLQQLSRETTDRLHIVWDEMGLSEEERRRQLTSLIEAVEHVFLNKVNDEVALRDEYMNEGKALEEQINQYSEMLAMERQHFPHDDSGNLMLKLQWLRSHVYEFEAVRTERLDVLEKLRDNLVAIRKEMGDEVKDTEVDLDKYLTPAAMEEYESLVIQATHEKNRRVDAIQSTIKDICDLYDELAFEIADELDKAIAQGGEGLGIDMGAVDILSKRARELTDEKISRTELVKQLASQIQPLWDRLGIDMETRKNFFIEHRGLGLSVIEGCEIELHRLQELKKEKMGELIEIAKGKMEELWEQLRYSEAQCEEFAELHRTDPVSEETLQCYEGVINDLTKQLELYRPILKAVEKYFHLYDEREEYEEKIQDSKRLLNRKKINLREEELQRKRVTVGLPRMIEKLTQLIQAYESEHGPFELEGQRFMQTMEHRENMHKSRLAEEKARRTRAKNAATTTSQTPGKMTKKAATMGTPRNRHPLGNRND
mmetsp:Transcript_22230/g.48346  ORF Transcript_22230/g.48346 Transcript_22230/m.48346 type:complete len:529 (-) Transcript_22230:30-1616(-)